MIESIDASRDVGLRRALIGLAIPMASEGTAARLCRAGFESLEEVADAGEEKLVAVEDIGPKVAASLTEHLHAPAAGARAPARARRLARRARGGPPARGRLRRAAGGQDRRHHRLDLGPAQRARRSRAPSFQRLCEKAGATTASSVSANTDMLITGADVGASKIAKAEKLEVEVVDQSRDLGAADRRRRGLRRGSSSHPGAVPKSEPPPVRRPPRRARHRPRRCEDMRSLLLAAALGAPALFAATATGVRHSAHADRRHACRLRPHHAHRLTTVPSRWPATPARAASRCASGTPPRRPGAAAGADADRGRAGRVGGRRPGSARHARRPRRRRDRRQRRPAAAVTPSC